MAEEDRIRAIVAEELRRRSGPPTSTVYMRTQQLLQNAVASVAAAPVNTSSTTSTTSSRISSTGTSSMSTPLPSSTISTPGPVPNPWAPPRSRSRSAPGHPYRLSAGQPASGRGGRFGGRLGVAKPMNVRLLAKDERSRYRCETRDIISDAEFVLMPGMTESEIRKKITEAFHVQYPLLLDNSFEFMRSEKNVVYKSSTSSSFKYNYDALKKSVRIYVRLLTDVRQLFGETDPIVVDEDVDEDVEDDDLLFGINNNNDNNQHAAQQQHQPATTSTSTQRFIRDGFIYDGHQPATEISQQRHQPARSDSSATSTTETAMLENLVDELLNRQDTNGSSPAPLKYSTTDDAIEFLYQKIDDDFEYKLKTEKDEEFDDTVRYYKGSNFDPKKKIIVRFTDQEGADAGGLLRQLFTTIFDYLEYTDRHFSGDRGHRFPRNAADLIMSGRFKILGKIFVHAIVQTKGTCGPMLFSEAGYQYLITGDVDHCIPFIVEKDVGPNVQHFINQVSAVTLST